MGSIDMMTAMILGLFINAIMGIIILITARQFPPIASRSMKYWSIGLFSLSISYWVYSGHYQKGFQLLDYLADTSVITGIALMAFAVNLILKTNQNKIIITVTCISWALLALTSLVLHHKIASIMITALTMATLTLILTKPLTLNIIKRPTSPKIILFSISAFLIFVMSYRGFYYLASQEDAWNYANFSTADFLTLLAAVVAPVIGTFGFMFMHQEKAYSELTRMASVDSLTQIYNRHAIEIKARDLFKRANLSNQALSVMLVDLDKFKQINDEYGHAAGDQVLIDTAHLIRGILGPFDLVGRFGGEEFFVLLPNSNLEQAQRLAQQMLKQIQSHTHRYGNHEFQITASIGVAQKQNNEDSFSATLKRADTAMYDAKKTGRNKAIAV